MSAISDYKLGDPQTGEPQLQSFLYDSLYRLLIAGATGGYQGAGDYGPEDYSYESTTGRMASKNSVSYTYNSGHFHAVSSLSNGNTYSYRCNGKSSGCSKSVREGKGISFFRGSFIILAGKLAC